MLRIQSLEQIEGAKAISAFAGFARCLALAPTCSRKKESAGAVAAARTAAATGSLNERGRSPACHSQMPSAGAGAGAGDAGTDGQILVF
jgi:hypothetical protein